MTNDELIAEIEHHIDTDDGSDGSTTFNVLLKVLAHLKGEDEPESEFVKASLEAGYTLRKGD